VVACRSGYYPPVQNPLPRQRPVGLWRRGSVVHPQSALALVQTEGDRHSAEAGGGGWPARPGQPAQCGGLAAWRGFEPRLDPRRTLARSLAWPVFGWRWETKIPSKGLSTGCWAAFCAESQSRPPQLALSGDSRGSTPVPTAYHRVARPGGAPRRTAAGGAEACSKAADVFPRAKPGNVVPAGTPEPTCFVLSPAYEGFPQRAARKRLACVACPCLRARLPDRPGGGFLEKRASTACCCRLTPRRPSSPLPSPGLDGVVNSVVVPKGRRGPGGEGERFAPEADPGTSSIGCCSSRFFAEHRGQGHEMALVLGSKASHRSCFKMVGCSPRSAAPLGNVHPGQTSAAALRHHPSNCGDERPWCGPPPSGLALACGSSATQGSGSACAPAAGQPGFPPW